ncbi:ABC transporter substrate-binding protein [Acetobacter sp. TBRC 12305]|uniref:ABC transporter substrate-binding protein n=1 Tax=Acetobacter garciniae TaxID=2817435 RepID=A0A939HLB2_9PROT|nr:ABC transporter substrate-binding protein [Acetobacter garciniae]MBO1326525.1 ABC transporter substrate-binding protein [Acetobacter garciniae]MBX0346293.1 ABC transporter substrate-binding protein [Acetobacter garciniae]
MKRMSFRAGVLLSMSMALLPVAGAGLSAPVAFAQSASAATPQAPIEALYKALDQIQHSHDSFAQRSQVAATAIDQSYDLDTFVKTSVGLRYNSLAPDEKQKLLTAFRNYTAARYVSNFKPGSDVRFTIAPTVTDSPVGGAKVVQTHLGTEESMPGTEVDYLMQNENGSWKIIDVLLTDTHISQAGAQRSDFTSTLMSGGVPALISYLERKVQSYSND